MTFRYLTFSPKSIFIFRETLGRMTQKTTKIFKHADQQVARLVSQLFVKS